jgi:hypothetical protein
MWNRRKQWMHRMSISERRKNGRRNKLAPLFPLLPPVHSVRGPLCVLLAAALIILNPQAVLACGGCFKLPYQSLLEKVERGDRVVVAHSTGTTGVTWKIDRVIKGRKANGDERIRADELSLKSRSNFHGTRLLTWNQVFDTWTIEAPANRELIDFLVRGLALPAKPGELMPIRQQAGQLRFFLPYLEDPDRHIADSTHSKLSGAPYAALQELASDLDADQLQTWIDDQSSAQNNRVALSVVLLGICGDQREADLVRKWIEQTSGGSHSAYITALLTAHVELNGEDAVRFLEKAYIQNRDRTLGELIAAVDALRTHGQAGTRISRERIKTSLRLLLRERPPLAELVIDDFARWQDWSIAPRLMQIHAGGKQPWNNALILKYMEACPLPNAKRFVENADTP